MECPDRPAQFQVAAADCADNIEENASNVQTTLHRLNPMLGVRTRAYWSSKGSRDEHSNEWLLLSLVHPLCLVQSVAIRPFRATFQWVRNPVGSLVMLIMQSCMQLLITAHTAEPDGASAWCQNLLCKQGSINCAYDDLFLCGVSMSSFNQSQAITD